MNKVKVIFEGLEIDYFLKELEQISNKINSKEVIERLNDEYILPKKLINKLETFLNVKFIKAISCNTIKVDENI